MSFQRFQLLCFHPSTEIFEGTGFTFALTASPIPIADLTVNLSASDNESGHFPGFPDSDAVIIDTTGRTEVQISATNVISTITENGQITNHNFGR